MDKPPPSGATPQDKAARAAGAPLLGLTPDDVTATIVMLAGDVRGYRVMPKGSRASGVGVVLIGSEALTDVASVRRSSRGDDPLVAATAVAVIHDGLITGPTVPDRRAPDVEPPRFDADGRLVYEYTDERGRPKRVRAVVTFADDGAVATVDRTDLPGR